jgi:glycine dehydrogenase subunit 1
VIRFNKPVNDLLPALAQRGIQAGYALNDKYPELKESVLLCVTETKSISDIQLLAYHIRDLLEGEK